MGYQLCMCMWCLICNAEGFYLTLGCALVNTSVMTIATQTVIIPKSEYLQANVLASFQIKKILLDEQFQ